MVVLEESTSSRRIAMLIDGDNAQPALLNEVITEAAKYGLVTIRRIYGDWTTPNMGGWKEMLHSFAIQPIQQFRYTTGKNATDSAMIIDAMDILHEGLVGGFCIVSSDSDYTRLATRIREKGLFVLGVGRSTTPRSFVNACDVFVHTENLAGEPATKSSSTRSRKKGATAKAGPMPLLRTAFEMTVQDDGWSSLGAMGTKLRQLDPSFDPRTYGHKQLSHLVRASGDQFEVRETKTRGGPTVIHIRVRD